MNERIRELIMSMGIIPEDEHYEVAELIVQECLQLCINVHTDADRPFSVPGSLHCMEEIREHFGVDQ